MAKYKVERTDGTPIPEDEPVFVLRAKDVLAHSTVEHYLDMCMKLNLPRDHTDAIEEHLERIWEYQHEHRDLVGIPD